MVARSILSHRLKYHTTSLISKNILSLSVARPKLVRPLVTAPKHSPQHNTPSSPSTSSAQSSEQLKGPKSTETILQTPTRPQPWLTRKLRENPTALQAFFGLARVMGYGSKKQLSGRRALLMYQRLCANRPIEERAFWQDECHLPPTFQSWFSVTNLHVWLLTVRLRALPDPYAKHHIQGLIDHFFLDVEDRVRVVLQPATRKNMPPSPLQTSDSTPSDSSGPSSPSNPDFYTIANGNGKDRPKGSAPERLVTRQMKILKEQWAGLGLSMDLSLMKGDAEMAGAIWRNFLGARGARGIVYPSSTSVETGKPKPYFRRSVNLVGGEVESVKKIDEEGLEKAEARDDGSGVHDYAPEEADKYVKYPELMEEIVVYVRRELKRLEGLKDEEVMGPMVMGKEMSGIEKLSFGKIRT